MIKKYLTKFMTVLLAFMVACVGLPVSASTNYIAFGEDLEELGIVYSLSYEPGVELTWYGTFRTYTVDDYYGEGMPDERIGITLVIENTYIDWNRFAGSIDETFSYTLLVEEPSGLDADDSVSNYKLDQSYIWDVQWFEFMNESTATVTASGNFLYTPWDTNASSSRRFLTTTTFEAYYIYGYWYDYWIS